MKIHQIPYGARFLHQGEEYVKTGPMLATGKDGQKLFPRHLELQALDAAVVTGKPSVMLPKADVLKAFDGFFGECRRLVDADRMAALETARTRFLTALE